MFAFIAMAGLATAAIGYYAIFSTTLTVEESITLSGCEDSVSGFDGSTVEGSVCTITNNAPSEREITISNDAPSGIDVSYIGSLELSKKDSEWNPIGEPETITYTIVGDEFEITGVPEGFVAIYYKDAVVELGERLDNPQPAISVVGIGNFPHANDANIDALADYCASDGYNQCKGAKVWLVSTEDIEGSTLNWANMANYYYEKDLIQYNDAGELTLSPESHLEVTPVYEIGIGMSGTYAIETTIA